MPESVALSQGDVLFDFLLFQWDDEFSYADSSLEEDCLKTSYKLFKADVVVMSQACDLEHGKVKNVLLCPHLAIQEYRKLWEQNERSKQCSPTEKSWKKFIESITNGSKWNLHILEGANVADIRMTPRIVDFHSIYTLPRNYIEAIITKRKINRLRLKSPYKEQLSQKYGNYYSRIGLPVNPQV